VGERYNRCGKRVLLQVDALTICSVPPQWTDLIAPDLEIAMGEGRPLLRIADFMNLARLVARSNPGDAGGATPFRIGVPFGEAAVWTQPFTTAP